MARRRSTSSSRSTAIRAARRRTTAFAPRPTATATCSSKTCEHCKQRRARRAARTAAAAARGRLVDAVLRAAVASGRVAVVALLAGIDDTVAAQRVLDQRDDADVVERPAAELVR